jgi:hypothetical protein
MWVYQKLGAYQVFHQDVKITCFYDHGNESHFWTAAAVVFSRHMSRETSLIYFSILLHAKLLQSPKRVESEVADRSRHFPKDSRSV